MYIYSERLKHIELPEGLNTLKRISLYGGRIETVLLQSDMVHLEHVSLPNNRIETFVIPEGAGSQAKVAPSALLRDNPLRSIQVPAKWRSGTHFNQALISTDRLGVDTSGNLRLPVVAEFGTVLIQKSTDLQNWTTIDELQFRGGDGTKIFRDRNVLSDASGFYRVRLKE